MMLLASGKQPVGVITSNKLTYVWLLVANNLWWVDIGHGGKRFSVAIA